MPNAHRDAQRRLAADEHDLEQWRASVARKAARDRKNIMLAKHAPYLAHDGFEVEAAQDLIEQWTDPTGILAREMLFQVIQLKDAVRKLHSVAREADKTCQRMLQQICDKYGRLPRAAQYTPPPEGVAAAGSDLEQRWRTQLPPRLVEHMTEAFTDAERVVANRSEQQREQDDQDLLQRFGATYPDPFTPRHQIPDEALADLDADLEAARANYIDLGVARSRTAPREGDDVADLMRLCTQETNWHQKERGARLVAAAQAMHDSGELRRNEYPYYPLNKDWSIFNAPFHRLPAKAQALLREHYPEEFARLPPGAATRPQDRRSPRQAPYKRPSANRVALGRRNTHVASHERHDREMETLGAAMGASTVHCKAGSGSGAGTSAGAGPSSGLRIEEDGYGYGYGGM